MKNWEKIASEVDKYIDLYVVRSKKIYGDNSKITSVLLKGYIDAFVDLGFIDEKDKEDYFKKYGDLR